MRWLWVATLGVALGSAAAQVDAVAGGLNQTPLWRAASMVLNAGSTWAGLAILSGYFISPSDASATERVRTIRVCALAGVLGLATALLAYYLYGLWRGDRATLGATDITEALVSWFLIAGVAGPILGTVGGLIHRDGWLGSTCAFVWPLGVFCEFCDSQALRLGFLCHRSLARVDSSCCHVGLSLRGRGIDEVVA